MKSIILFCLFSLTLFATNKVLYDGLTVKSSTLIGTKAGNTPDTKSILELYSTTQGFLTPRMTTTQRDAISSPPAGLIIYNTTDNALQIFIGTWQNVTQTASGDITGVTAGTGLAGGGSVGEVTLSLANYVVTTPNTSGTRVAGAKISQSGSHSVTAQDGSWISSVADGGAGVTNITIANGTFSASPYCVFTTGDAGMCGFMTVTSSTSISASFRGCSSGTQGDVASFYLICTGTK